MSERLSEEEREVARQRLADLNVDGWRLDPAHGCDGTEEVCAATCPIPVQVQVSPDEIIDAITEPLTAHLADQAARLAAAEALHGGTHWCTTDDEQAEVFERGVIWPCPTYAALHPDASETP